jgi:hypothetical protein
MRSKLAATFSILVLFSSSQTYNYYFGNLHAHTGLSDGSKDSLNSGVSKPDGAYLYAKLSQDFDFLGISEHNHYSANNNPGFKRPSYPVGLNMANAANQEGTFLALFGMEYGVSSGTNGHVLIYGFNSLLGWEPGNYDIYNAKSNYDSLFRKVKNNSSAFAYLAHPSFSDFSSSGAVAGALAYAPYNAMYDSAIVGTPLRSGLAFSAANDYSDYSQGNYFAYYLQLLSKGYHLGIGYDHDNHYTNFGRSNGGRLVILAPSLTRANLLTAMQQMHFYGSDDQNARIGFDLDGQVMGSRISGGTYPTLSVTHNDPDGEPADSIKIWKGANDGSGQLPVAVHVSLNSNTASFTDYNLQNGVEYYYFTEIKQADGQWIVTSPIWYRSLVSQGLRNENKARLKLLCFSDPVSRRLSMSVSEPGRYAVKLQDVSGRMLVDTAFEGQETSLDLSPFPAGCYLLSLVSGKAMVVKKLLVD